MKVYRLPRGINALIFDMDLTLYSHAEYGRLQIDLVVERLGKIRGLSFGDMAKEIAAARETWTVSHNGKKPSLSNILSGYGIGMEENIRWREELCDPAAFLKQDARLQKTLRELSSAYILGVVTNNPALVAAKTLAALGVQELLPIVVGLDTCMVAKPHRAPFERFAELSGVSAETCVSIGDRYDIDLALPLEMGMGGILVDGVEDVYGLPAILMQGGSNEQGRRFF